MKQNKEIIGSASQGGSTSSLISVIYQDGDARQTRNHFNIDLKFFDLSRVALSNKAKSKRIQYFPAVNLHQIKRWITQHLTVTITACYCDNLFCPSDIFFSLHFREHFSNKAHTLKSVLQSLVVSVFLHNQRNPLWGVIQCLTGAADRFSTRNSSRL